MLQLAAHRDNIHRIQVRVQTDVAHYLLNRKRKDVSHLEESGQIQVDVTAVPYAIPGALWIAAEDIDRREGELPRDRDIVLYCS